GGSERWALASRRCSRYRSRWRSPDAATVARHRARRTGRLPQAWGAAGARRTAAGLRGAQVPRVAAAAMAEVPRAARARARRVEREETRVEAPASRAWR